MLQHENTILGFSSDEDWHLLKAMIFQSQFLNRCSPKWMCFHMDLKNYGSGAVKASYIQNTVHVSTKLKTKFQNKDNKLIQGQLVVNILDIENIMRNHLKVIHLLIESDIKSDYKFNYRAAKKLTSSFVLNLLKSKNCLGTAAYLK